MNASPTPIIRLRDGYKWADLTDAQQVTLSGELADLLEEDGHEGVARLAGARFTPYDKAVVIFAYEDRHDYPHDEPERVWWVAKTGYLSWNQPITNRHAACGWSYTCPWR
jgi:hypothetical protein